MLPNHDWTDLEPDRVQSGRWFPGEDDEQKDPVQGLRDDFARGLDDGWSQGSRNSDRGHRASVLDAGGEREHAHNQNKKC